VKATRLVASSIAVVDASTAKRTAGGTVSRTMLRAMIAAGGAKERSLLFVTSDDGAAGALENSGAEVVHLRHAPTTPLAGVRSSRSGAERKVRRALALPDAADPLAYVRHRNPEVVLPLLSVPPRPRLRGVVGWLPDFQHRALPMYFSDAERAVRDRSYRAVCRRANVVMLSSHAMAREFNEYYPQWRSKVRVLSFPSALTFADLDADPRGVIDRYSLPPKFALVANQFWQHKNHSVVVEALDRLKATGPDIPLVMTGLPADYRDPSNETVSRVLQQVAKCGLVGRVIILGQVPYPDLVSLMRVAAIVVQPSLYEGWNTSVEDAKALGRPLVCSDIAVHREQVSDDAGVFFDPKDSEALASQLASAWAMSQPWSLGAEHAALARSHESGLTYGRRVLDVCDEISADA
jgi:glycosyltransferase involved in cell wall biosynthesis